MEDQPNGIRVVVLSAALWRSAIINLSRVRSVEAELRGDGLVVRADGTRLKVIRNRREVLERKLEALHDSG